MITARNGRCVRRNCRDIVEIKLCSSSAMLTVSARASSTLVHSQAYDLTLRRLDRIPIGLFELASARTATTILPEHSRLRIYSSSLSACDVSPSQPSRNSELT
jgi:hypothetical protein